MTEEIGDHAEIPDYVAGHPQKKIQLPPAGDVSYAGVTLIVSLEDLEVRMDSSYQVGGVPLFKYGGPYSVSLEVKSQGQVPGEVIQLLQKWVDLEGNPGQDQLFEMTLKLLQK